MWDVLCGVAMISLGTVIFLCGLPRFHHVRAQQPTNISRLQPSPPHPPHPAMLRQSLFRAAVRRTNPLLFASPNTALLLDPPKNALLRSPLLPHSIRAYARPLPLRRSPNVARRKDANSEEAIQAIEEKERESMDELFNVDLDGKKSRTLLILFTMLALPVTILFQFPTRTLPPVPDPPELQHLSHTPLTARMWLTSPLTSLQLFSFRLRRAEYLETIRRHFSFSPLNYMGYDREGNREPWRWWTWGTYMFAHGSILHFGGCFFAMSSILPLLTPQYGVVHTLGLFAAGGVGAAAATCITESIRHGQEIREGKGTQLVTKRLKVATSTGQTIEKDVQLLSPAPGMEKVFSTNIGSSGGLMAMLTVIAIAMPATNWGLIFIPVRIPARTLFAGLVTWDTVSAFGWFPDLGIGHVGHLGGDVIGMLAYMLVFRKLPIGRMLTYVRKQQGFR